MPLFPKARTTSCAISGLSEIRGFANDVEFCRFLVKDIGVAAVPGSSFFRDPAAGKDIIRFTFCKKESTLAAAEERLVRLIKHITGGGVQVPRWDIIRTSIEFYRIKFEQSASKEG